MPHASVNGIKLHYQQIGQGSDIVMVHGITGNLAIWHLEIIPGLMDSHRLTTYDLRGHGYSDMPPTGYTTADHAEDLRQLLEGLGIDRAHVVGHSFGADISLHYTVLYPDRVDKLVLVEPAIPALQFMRDRKDWVGWKYWRDKLGTGGVSVPEDKWYDSEFLVRASINLPMVFGFRKGKPRRAAPLVQLMDTTTAAVDYSKLAGMTLDKIRGVRHPVLVVYGADSVFLDTYEFLRQNLPDCTAVLMPDSEHFGPLEQPEFLMEHMLKFLAADPVG